VSVGEVLALAGLVTELRKAHPERYIFVSTTTATGQELARKRFGEDSVFYFPLDFAFAIRPYLRALQPELVIVAETEFWPNFLRLCRAAGAQIAIVNARISDRSLPRYMRLRGLVLRVLSNVSVFLAQSDEDQRRLIGIGADPDRVQVSGNLKFDLAPPSNPPAIVGQLRTALLAGGATAVIVAGSTVDGEEPQVLSAFRALLHQTPNAVLILAPRHPQRFEEVSALIESSGLKHWRRSAWKGSDPVCGGVFLLDTIGELGAVYSVADIAFVGGSLVPRGGHNILEPATYAVPVIVGPHTENFRDTMDLFTRAAALTVVHDEHGLEVAFLDLLANGPKRRDLGQRAFDLLQQQSGATTRTLATIDHLLAASPARPQWSDG
jgi:3-deoxy-D-manno-octulosonic-acid transferase